MRARPREINIFNMSLLDILCGALGAFCFMMLVALPYYVGGKGGKDRVEREKEIEVIIAKIEQYRLTLNLSGGQAEDLRKLLEELEAKIKGLEGQLNQSAYENQQLKNQVDQLTDTSQRLTSENKQLTAENDSLKIENDLLKKNQGQTTQKPWVMLASSADDTQDIAFFPQDIAVGGVTEKAKLANPEFDPNLSVREWENDVALYVPTHGVSFWIREPVAKSSYRVFLRYRPQTVNRGVFLFTMPQRATRVNVSFFGNFEPEAKATRVELSPEHPWGLAGTINVDEKGKLSFVEASQAERDETWAKVTREHPTPTPTATPTATPAPSMSREDMERIRKRAEEIRKQKEERERQQQQQNGPFPIETSPTPSVPNESSARHLHQGRAPAPTTATPEPSATP
ncbi:MAG: hypothetical protein M3128_09600 [Verrucomicrobiota bacterium]|nr:hypothetical protein [Verrucomicrobiota bacterium]